ncbi:efflux RND transporter permease subunit, partial [Klebsiella pneumoniae]|uniref:efflux RND transporter permease subunit n=1 Tax=Klebsiella pneumoniae TaxID=573 RepID=UPI00272F56C4
LKPIEKGDHGEHKGGFFGWFNRMFLSTTPGYERGVASILKHRAPYLLIYVVIVAGMIWMFTRIPTAFLPDEDQGVLFAQVQTPPGS